MFKRIVKEQRSLESNSKRKRGSEKIEGDEGEKDIKHERKKYVGFSSKEGFTCTTGCKTKRCSCKKSGPLCTLSCECIPSKCANREVPGSSSLSSAADYNGDYSGWTYQSLDSHTPTHPHTPLQKCAKMKMCNIK